MDNSPSVPPQKQPPAPFPLPPRDSGAAPASGPVRFSGRPPTLGLKPLVLPRRVSPLQRVQEATQATAAARKSIGAILQSNAPWPGAPTALSSSQLEELEKAVRVLESKVAEQEMALADTQNKLADRERALAEAEALLLAREKVIDAMRRDKASAVPGTGAKAVSGEEVDALKKLKEELERQEASLKEQREAIREREVFLDQSEAALFDKMQAQQEQETALEQKAEDVKRAMLRAGMIKAEPLPPMEKA